MTHHGGDERRDDAMGDDERRDGATGAGADEERQPGVPNPDEEGEPGRTANAHDPERVLLTTRGLLGTSAAAAAGGLAGCTEGIDGTPAPARPTDRPDTGSSEEATTAGEPGAGTGEVRESWRHLPEIRAPRLPEGPTIDGELGDGWARAAQLQPPINSQTERMTERRTEVYVAHTEEALYVGWRIHRETDVPMAISETEPGHVQGTSVYGDDCVEVFLDRERDGSSSVSFAGNPAGAYSDGLLNGSTDAQNYAWDWDYAARQTDFGWEGELRITFDELGFDGPPAPDEPWGFNVWRNDKTPNLVVTGWQHGGWKGGEGVLHFGEDAPTVRVTDGGLVGDESVGLRAELLNDADAARDVVIDYGVYRRHDEMAAIDFIEEVRANLDEGDLEVASFVDPTDQIDSQLDTFYDPLVERRRTVTVESGGSTTVDLLAEDITPGDFVVMHHARTEDGRTLSTGTLPARMWDPVEVATIPYYLSTETLDVEVTLHRTDLEERVSDVRLTLQQGDRTVDERVTSIDAAGDGVGLSTADVDPGDYTLLVETLDEDGAVVEEIEVDESRPDPPFWVTQDHGTSAFVPDPWTPVDASADLVSVLDRTYAFEDSVLPAQMSATGEALFDEAPRLVTRIDGEEHRVGGTPELVETDPEYADYRWSGTAGPVDVEATIRVEFDGFSTLDLEIDAAGATVEELFVEFPLDAAHAELYTFGPYYDERRGTNVEPLTDGLDRSGRIPDEGFEIGFNHSVWLGTPDRGFYWCAERAQHWHTGVRDPEERDDVIELLPDEEAGQALFRLRVIDAPTEVDTLQYRWGLLATPSCPGPRTEADELYYVQDNYPGDLSDEGVREEVEDRIEDYHRIDADWVSVFSQWNSDFAFGQPIRETDGVVDRRELSTTLNDAGFDVAWYAGWNGLTANMSDYPHYGEAMRMVPTRFGYGGFKECTYGGYTEYLANGSVWMVDNIGADGIYLDSTHGPNPCYDEHHDPASGHDYGCGFEDPETGNRVVTRDIWGRRELFKRLYKIFHGEVVDDGIIYSHGGFYPPVTAFVDVHHTGEGAGMEDYQNLDFYLAQYSPTQFGTPVEHAWRHGHPVPRNFAWGVSLIHDNRLKMYPPFAKSPSVQENSYEPERGIDWRMWVPNKWFDWSVDHEWYPYHDNGDVLDVGGERVLASFHHNEDDQLFLSAMNMEDRDQPVTVAFDVDALDLPEALHARDVVTHEAFEIRDGEFDLELLGHRPRVLMIHDSPVPRMGPGVDD